MLGLFFLPPLFFWIKGNSRTTLDINGKQVKVEEKTAPIWRNLKSEMKIFYFLLPSFNCPLWPQPLAHGCFPFFTEDNLTFPFTEKVDDSTLIFEWSFPSFTYQSNWVHSPNPCTSCQNLPLVGKANYFPSLECTPLPQECILKSCHSTDLFPTT